jgi:putative FmdB family regulatory protein
MTTYTFACDEHGEFDVSRSMADAGQPSSCPVCGATARRVFNPSCVAIRPDGYNLPYGHPDYWSGFDDPVVRYRWQTGNPSRRDSSKEWK